MADKLEGGTERAVCRECDVDAETFDEYLSHSDETGHRVALTFE